MGRGLRIVAIALVAVVAAVVAAAVSVGAWILFFFGTCSVFDDTGGAYPVNDSPQGQVCGQSDLASEFEQLAYWSIPAVAAMAVVLVVVAWWRGGPWFRVCASSLLLVGPVMSLLLLSLPSDACTSEVRAQPHSQCSPD
jgi:hypothetical protein